MAAPPSKQTTSTSAAKPGGAPAKAAATPQGATPPATNMGLPGAQPVPTRKSMGETVKAAWIAFGPALLAALLAFAAALVTGFITADNVNRQVTGETERSRAEFLRSQRLTVYTDFLATEGSLRNEELGLWYEYYDQGIEPTAKQYREYRDPLNDRSNELRTISGSIDVIASTDAVNAATEVHNIHSAKYLIIDEAGNVQHPTPKQLKDFGARMKKEDDKLFDLIKKFKTAARVDLNA